MNTRLPLLSSASIAQKAFDLGINGYEFVEYAPLAKNIDGIPWQEYQSRHCQVFGIGNANPLGLFLIFHGGGGDVGYAENADILNKAVYLANLGYIAVCVEYRRGWSNVGFTDDEIDPDSPEAQRNLFDLTEQEYRRQEYAARLSFEDGLLALDFLFHRYRNAADVAVYMEGTSFGAAMVLDLTVMNTSARKYNIKGAIAGFGGVNKDDLVFGNLINPTACPMLLIGGTADPIVPFWQGEYYCKGMITGLGSGAIAGMIRAKGGIAYLIGTTNKGHGYGAIDESKNEQFQTFFSMMSKVENGEDVNKNLWLKLGPNKTKSLSTEMDAVASFNVRCNYAV